MIDVRCPACGAPLRIDPRAAVAVCGHCRVQSRVERVASERDLAAPGDGRVIRVVVRGGVSLAVRALAFAAGLVAIVVAGLAVSFVVDSVRPGVESDAVFVQDLAQGAGRLDSYEAVAVLTDGTVVVGSGTGRIALVDSRGELEGTLDLPLPAVRARLAGLAPDRSGGFYASLGGAILHVSAARTVDPPQPADPALRVYGAIAVDPRGQLHAITAQGNLVQVDGEGRPTSSSPLGLPLAGEPLDVRSLAFAPDGRAVVREPLGDRIWWVDASRSTSTLVERPPGPRVGSTVVSLPDGSLVLDTRSALVRLSPDGRSAADLRLTRPPHLDFQFLAADADGGVAALSQSGTLVRYDARRLAQ